MKVKLKYVLFIHVLNTLSEFLSVTLVRVVHFEVVRDELDWLGRLLLRALSHGFKEQWHDDFIHVRLFRLTAGRAGRCKGDLRSARSFCCWVFGHFSACWLRFLRRWSALSSRLILAHSHLNQLLYYCSMQFFG